MRDLLQTHSNWTVCGEAADGVEAVEKAFDLRPDLVVMDISMPRASGLDASRQILRELPQCSVVILTQNDPVVARIQAAAVNAAGFVAKSELRKELVATLERIVENRKPEPEGSPENGTTSEWLAGGELGRLIQEFDWSSTPLGPMEEWPASLKTMVRVLETSRFAMWMGWGEELTFFYNDAYAKMTLGKKHPWALGKPSKQVWAEIWDDIGPRIQQVLKSGVATWDEALLLFLERSGYREETYHTFSYSPLPGDDGRISGHLCVVTEDTDRVVGERRLKTLRASASELNSTINEQDVCSAIDALPERKPKGPAIHAHVSFLPWRAAGPARMCERD